MQRSHHILGLILTSLLGSGSADAQVYYGGYNLGPDYSAMLNEALARNNALNDQIHNAETSLVQQVMQNPQAQAMYQQHLAQGGQLSFEQFAYQYAATGGFTPAGLANYRRSEAVIAERDRNAWLGYRDAEIQRGNAQAGYMDAYHAGQAEAGNVLQGNSTWVDPNTGANTTLAYTGANVSVDPGSGRAYYRDASGQYYAQDGYGNWYAMTPAQ